MQDLIEKLKNGVVKVTFKKADGSVREMDATLCDYLLPETHQKSNHPEGETCIVFDLDAEGWRSFRFDRILKTEVYE
jgi:hypothetical protein